MLLHALQEAPHRFDFFQALRRIECAFADKPRLGEALRPADEPIRLAQEPALTFAPATLSAFRMPAGQPPRMEVRFLGLLGPNGPLPLHLTEYARERLLHHGDATLSRFLDLFHHRFLALFYRAWAQAQPTVSLDRPDDDRFSAFVGAIFGLGTNGMRGRDAVPDFAKLFHAGLLARQVRNRDGLVALLAGYFRIPVEVESFVGHWMVLSERDRSSLGANEGAVLGRSAVLGSRVWDRQHKFRIHLGPLPLTQYESFLPGGRAILELQAWVRTYLCMELQWDVCLLLARGEVPELRLGAYGRLGWTSWLGRRRGDADAADLTLDVERVMRRFRSARARGASAESAEDAAAYA